MTKHYKHQHPLQITDFLPFYVVLLFILYFHYFMNVNCKVLAETCSEYMIRHQRENLNTPPPEPDSDDDTREENTEASAVGEKTDACIQTEIKEYTNFL